MNAEKRNLINPVKGSIHENNKNANTGQDLQDCLYNKIIIITNCRAMVGRKYINIYIFQSRTFVLCFPDEKS